MTPPSKRQNTIPVEELERRISELETSMGVQQTDKRAYQKLTRLQWYFTLSWCSPHRPYQNKKQFAEDIQMSRQIVHSYDGNDTVKRAVKTLDNTVGSIRASNVLSVVLDRAEKGDYRFCKLVLDRYRPVDEVKEIEEEKDTSPSWDLSLGLPKEEDPKSLEDKEKLN